jgi:hypothetical protein
MMPGDRTAGSRRIKEQDKWAKELFPAVHEQLTGSNKSF